MDLTFKDTEEGVRELFANFFAAESPLAIVRSAEPLGFDAQVWTRLWQTGAPMMGVPEVLRGGGATAVELALLAEELGRNLAPVPLVEHLVATWTLATAGQGELLDILTHDSAIATIALQPVRDGVARLVPAGAIASIALLWDGDEFVALRRAQDSQSRRGSPRNFGCSPIADWSFFDPGAERTVLGAGEDARRLFCDAVSLWQLLTAAALNGLAARALSIAVEYVQHRKAFGVPIGSFQAVRHRLADAAVSGDGSSLLTYEAAWAHESDERQWRTLSAMAFIFASETAFRTCREALQFHGGYGFTLEYDIQLFFRRAKAWPLAIGDLRSQYLALADNLYPISTAEANTLERGR